MDECITYSDCLILHHFGEWRLREDGPFARENNVSEPQISCSMQTDIPFITNSDETTTQLNQDDR